MRHLQYNPFLYDCRLKPTDPRGWCYEIELVLERIAQAGGLAGTAIGN